MSFDADIRVRHLNEIAFWRTICVVELDVLDYLDVEIQIGPKWNYNSPRALRIQVRWGRRRCCKPGCDDATTLQRVLRHEPRNTGIAGIEKRLDH
jgi:hypothetical protein